MKITVKTTQQKIFHVDVDPEQTVADLKTKIAESQGHPVASQKIIFSGKILNNDQTVESCGIKEKDFLVLMVSKPKQSAPAPSSVPTPPVASSPAQPPTPEAPAAEPSDPNVATTNQPPPPAPGPSEAPAFGDTSSFLTGSHLDTAINNMIEMGFSREQVTRAMRASFNNADRAVEYLMTGIPSQLLPEPSATAAPISAPPPPPAPVQTPAVPNQPQNLFQLAQQQQQQAGLQGTPIAPPRVSPAGGLNPDALRNAPQLQQLRQLIAQNPAALQPLLQQLAAGNPGLAQNPEALLQALAEAENDGEDDGIPPGAQVINVTEEERAAIERLVALGFSRESAIQAYFACDKNEELAANYLFESGFDD